MEYMRSVRQRNLIYRGIVLGILVLVAGIVSSIIPKTSAHEEGRPREKEIQEDILTTESKRTYTIKEGDTFLAIFQLELGISYEDSLMLIDTINEIFDITKIKKDAVVQIFEQGENLVRFSYDINSEEELVVSKFQDTFSVERKEIIYEVKESVISGVVSSSFYQSALDAGLTDRMIMELATVFAWDVDFTSSIQEGDTFSLVFQNKYRNGEFAGTGDLLAGKFMNNGEEFFTFLVKNKDGENKYYNEAGEATERLLLKTPLSYKRISSGFSMSRKHPILGTFKTHRAIDFAASTGTPVETVGDGTVVYSGWNGAYGNFVKIDHGQGFATAYAHLSKIYVSKGARVKQGDLIGAVGTTGRSTGPHLHYEMYKNGTLVHPLETKTPGGTPISQEQKPLLEQVVLKYKEQL
jgi:murein DD-endopeptidase MepM/ murein hydrolase activator NlpD